MSTYYHCIIGIKIDLCTLIYCNSYYIPWYKEPSTDPKHISWLERFQSYDRATRVSWSIRWTTTAAIPKVLLESGLPHLGQHCPSGVWATIVNDGHSGRPGTPVDDGIEWVYLIDVKDDTADYIKRRRQHAVVADSRPDPFLTHVPNPFDSRIPYHIIYSA